MNIGYSNLNCLRLREWPLTLPVLWVALVVASAPASKGAVGDNFEKLIRPILVEHCYECHSVAKKKNKGGLQLDSIESLRKGGDSGEIFQKGQSEKSIIYKLISHREPEERMPPDYRLSEDLIERIKNWIDNGAQLPDSGHIPEVSSSDSSMNYPEDWEEHWSFQPINTLTNIGDSKPESEWIRNPIDSFIFKKLREQGLKPSKRADWRRLVRRLYLDITGLPPSSVEMKDFLNSPGLESYEKLIDDLLGRKEFGEHWARMWLDVARYADSNGSDENLFYANAHRYRDYVINSFNQDKSYFLFIKEQIAGDILAVKDDGSFNSDALVATGFLNLGPKLVAEQDKEKLRMDLVDEQMDVLGQAFLGISIGCARCHDHKFDPFTQEDYYALAGIFRSTQSMSNYDHVSKWLEKPLEHPNETAKREAHIENKKKLESKIESLLERAKTRLGNEIKNLDYRHLIWVIQNNKPADISPIDQLMVTNWEKVKANLRNDSAPHWRHLFEKYALQEPKDLTTPQIEERSKRLVQQVRDILGKNNGVEYSKDAKSGYALKTHKRSTIEIPHDDAFEPTEMTISSWVKISNFPKKQGDSRRWIISKNDDEHKDGHYALGISRNSPMAYINIGGGPNNAIIVSNSNSRIEKNTWTHLALAISKTQITLFLNGKKIGSSRLPKPRTSGSESFAIGKRPDNYNFFNGSIDDVYLFKSALSQIQIEHLYRGETQSDAAKHIVFSDNFNIKKEQFIQSQVWQQIKNESMDMSGLFALPEDPSTLYKSQESEKLAALEEELTQINTSIRPDPGTAISVEEGEVTNLKLQVRGNHLIEKGAPILRRMPMAHIAVKVRDISPEKSGREELAEWLTHESNPLTSRVMVNRLWAGVFGRGIVSSPNNFGRRGMPPSHPELLDWLAGQLIKDKGSIKGLLKIMFSSSTYMQDSRPNSENQKFDPQNKFLWRMPPRRMTVEQMRDSLLKVSGLLDLKTKGKPADISNYQYVPKSDYFNKIISSGARTIYLPIIRDRVHPDIEIFDFANPGTSIGYRQTTTVPLQALFFLNNSKVANWAQSIALLASKAEDPVGFLFAEILGRPASEKEIELLRSTLPGHGNELIPSDQLREIALSLFATNEFIYRL